MAIPPKYPMLPSMTMARRWLRKWFLRKSHGAIVNERKISTFAPASSRDFSFFFGRSHQLLPKESKQDPDLHAFFNFPVEPLDHLVAHPPVGPNVDHDIDGRSRAVDILQKRFQKGVAVVQCLDRVALVDRQIERIRE